MKNKEENAEEEAGNHTFMGWDWKRVPRIIVSAEKLRQHLLYVTLTSLNLSTTALLEWLHKHMRATLGFPARSFQNGFQYIIPINV